MICSWRIIKDRFQGIQEDGDGDCDGDGDGDGRKEKLIALAVLILPHVYYHNI